MRQCKQEDEGFNWHFAICWFVIMPLYLWFLVELIMWAWRWFNV